jgi:hypothetical protein
MTTNETASGFRSPEEETAATEFNQKKINNETEIQIPEGKFESPEKKQGRSRKPIGQVEVPGFGELEFFMPNDILEPDGLDLVALNKGGEEFNCIKFLLNYNDEEKKYGGVIKKEKLFDVARDNKKFLEIIDQYQLELTQNTNLYIKKRVELSNNHLIRVGHFQEGNEEKSFEFIHQQKPGDCILATTLNTLSFNEKGHLPFTINELRRVAIDLRKGRDEDTSDIKRPDSSLNFRDFVYLFAELTGRKPKQEDVISVSGVNRTGNQIKLDILDIFDKLAASDYRTLAIGTRNHARSLKYLEDGNFALIDPMSKRGVKVMSLHEAHDFLFRECQGTERDHNSFYII